MNQPSPGMVLAQFFLPKNNTSVNYRYIESIHSMKKPVISSEISPKFDGFKT